jgi:hypothetical protein
MGSTASGIRGAPRSPGVTPKAWLESGYMKKADTLASLAEQCGIDAGGLAKTVERWNGFCRTGGGPRLPTRRALLRSRARRSDGAPESESRPDLDASVPRRTDGAERRRDGGAGS